MLNINLFGKNASGRKPPALSYKTLTNFLDSFQRRDIPSHIDKSVLPSSMSGGNQSYLINALKFMGLVSENNTPQERFYRLARAEHSMRASILRDILLTSYGFILTDFDISNATTQTVVDKFKEQGLTGGDELRKAIIFFLNAAKDAEIRVSPLIKPLDLTKLAKTERTGKNLGAKELTYQLTDLLEEEMNEEEENAVWTLIRYLKRKKAMTDKQDPDIGTAAAN
jgi:hypothetical protein